MFDEPQRPIAEPTGKMHLSPVSVLMSTFSMTDVVQECRDDQVIVVALLACEFSGLQCMLDSQ